MKHRFFISLLASLVMGGETVAQKVLLPYGQETKEAWDASAGGSNQSAGGLV